MKQKQTFEEWMAKVNSAVEHDSSMSASDLPDVPYREWYDDDMTPRAAARKAIKNANE
jgi:hypothetical protein